ncbi:YheC/YheD family protein [Paenibacillus sp. GCM10027628]|uniref:YheC/YheD family protein n=1 Tax=Paenibacillus sp. GCM10027628 TaxID=3273413 RepID=UPI00362FB981
MGLHQFYMKDDLIRAYLPHTEWLNRNTFTRFIQKYRSVYLKPNMSHMGKGIMKAWKVEGGFRLVKMKGIARQFKGKESLFNAVRQQAASTPYIIQKAIDLAEIKGRPFDIRVMMMRNRYNRWQYVGMLAKVAGKSSVITNVNRGGGYAVEIDKALAASLSLSKLNQKRLIRELVRLSYRICNRFIRYKYSSQIGVDFALDRQGKIWVIEVNFDFPSHELFARLKNKSIYRGIKVIRHSYLKALKSGSIQRK